MLLAAVVVAVVAAASMAAERVVPVVDTAGDATVAMAAQKLKQGLVV